jgi:purine-nucleoside phosphorylase
MFEKIKETVSFIESRIPFRPQLLIVLGSGLGNIISEIKEISRLEYKEIPNFPVSTVEGHKGALIFGECCDRKIVIMQGRFHFYEGYSMDQVIFPIRVLSQLGCETLLASNAAGGLNPDYNVGDIMVFEDHINFMPNSLIGKHYPEFGPRFPDMSNVYDPVLIDRALAFCELQGISVHRGVYIGVTGPSYETRAECYAYRNMGADAVGMSTVPESIAARQMGMKCFAVSIITNQVGRHGIPLSHEEVLQAANKASSALSALFINLLN